MFVLNLFIQCFQIKLNLNFPDWLLGRRKKFEINCFSSVIAQLPAFLIVYLPVSHFACLHYTLANFTNLSV